MDTLDEFVIDTRPPLILLPDFCLKCSLESRTEIKSWWSPGCFCLYNYW